MTQLGLARLLIVSREPSALRPLWSVGRSNDWQLETADNGWDALERLQAGSKPDLLILESSHDTADCLHTLRWLRRVRPDLPIVVLADIEGAAQKSEAIRLGAQEYLVSPLKEEVLDAALKRHLMTPGVEIRITEIASIDPERIGEDMYFIAAGPATRKLRTQAELLAQLDVPVFILGENGTGKEVTARLIHKLSNRSSHHFVKVNCAALPSDVLENELFGHEGGAANGTRTRAGKLELCDKGTILLEEITEMPSALQGRLLRLLQDKQFFRQGRETAVDVDVRILASSSANLDHALAEKKLREDLYYQLSAFIVHVPALRQRKEEIPALLNHFMGLLSKHYGLPERDFPADVLESCKAYSWPGNLRELENIAKRHLVIGDQELALGDLERSGVFASEPEAPAANATNSENGSTSLKSFVQSVKGEAERNAIAAALDKTRWNRKAAARLLKVSYRTLLYKIEQYRMTPPAYVSGLPSDPGMKGSGRGL
jgi:DNA-binding NtrC family response regulator